MLGTVSLSLGLDLRHKARVARIADLALVLALGLWVQYVTGYFSIVFCSLYSSDLILLTGWMT